MIGKRKFTLEKIEMALQGVQEGRTLSELEKILDLHPNAIVRQLESLAMYNGSLISMDEVQPYIRELHQRNTGVPSLNRKRVDRTSYQREVAGELSEMIGLQSPIGYVLGYPEINNGTLRIPIEEHIDDGEEVAQDFMQGYGNLIKRLEEKGVRLSISYENNSIVFSVSGKPRTRFNPEAIFKAIKEAEEHFMPPMPNNQASTKPEQATNPVYLLPAPRYQQASSN